MGRGGKAGHLYPYLCHQHFCCPSAYARHCVQPGQRLVKRAHSLLDLGTHLLDGVVQKVNVGQLLCHQETLVGTETSFKSPLQLPYLLSEPSLGQLR